MELNRFEDIVHLPLRAYNRAVMSFNINEDFGPDACKEYLASFNQQEKKDIYLIILTIGSKGKDAAYRAATKGLKISEEID